MSESNPTEKFLDAYRRDFTEGSVHSPEDYHDQFPSVTLDVIRATLLLTDNLLRDVGHVDESGVFSQVGPYRIIKELGRGGQGVVFLAEDTRLGRQVALKVLTSWSQVSPKVIARFQREAAIASKLDHPGICTVYEIGDASGAPFMAMRFVEGMSLSAKISTAASGESRAETSFIDLEHVSEADLLEEEEESETSSGTSSGSHATQTAIEAVVHMIEKTARALHTAHEAGVIHRDIKPGNIMITKGGEPVILDFGLARDTDGDHQTLTQTGDLFGTPAYMAPEQLMAQRIQIDRRADVWALGVTLFESLGLQRPFKAPTRDGLYQQILHKDPIDLRKLNDAVPKDLRIIVEMAIEKDRDRRYQSALELAEDLRRFRELKPIHAKPVGQVTRLVRWAQRNTAVAAALVLVLVSLSGGLLVSLQQKARADDERARAEKTLDDLRVEQTRTKKALEETEAERVKTAEALTHAEAVKDFLNDDVLGQVSPEDGDKDVLVRDILEKASKSIEGKFEKSPLIEGSIRNTMGKVFMDLGVFGVAQVHFERALELRREHLGEDHPNTLTTMNNVAVLYQDQGKYDLALPLYVKALEARRRVLGEDHPSTLSSMNNIGLLYRQQGKFDLALPLCEKTLEAQRRVLGEDHPHTLTSMNNLAGLYKDQGKYDLALPLYKKTLETSRRILSEDHPSTLTSMNNLALLYQNQGKFDLALPLCEKTLEARRRVLGEDHPHTLFSLSNLAMLHQNQRKYDLARPLHVKALEARRRVLGEEHRDTLGSMNNLAELYRNQGKYDLALPLFEKILEAQHRTLGEDHPDALTVMNNLAELYRKQGKYDLALPLHEKALEGRRRVLGEDHPDTLSAMINLARVYQDQEKYNLALPLLERALEARCRVSGEEHSSTLLARYWLGICLVNLKLFPRAESALLASYDGCMRVLGENHRGTTASIEELVSMYKAWDKPEEAAKWQAKLPKKEQKPPEKKK